MLSTGARRVVLAMGLVVAVAACAAKQKQAAAVKAPPKPALLLHVQDVAVGTTADVQVLSSVSAATVDVAFAEPAGTKGLEVVGWARDVIKVRALAPGTHALAITARQGEQNLQATTELRAQAAVSMAFLAAGCPSGKVVAGSRVRLSTRLLSASMQVLAGAPPFPKAETPGLTFRAGPDFLDVLVPENTKAPVVLKAPRGMRLAGDEEIPGKGLTLLGLDGTQKFTVVPWSDVTAVALDGWFLAPPRGPLPPQHYVHHVTRGVTLDLFVRVAPPLCGMLPIQVTNHSVGTCVLEGPTADHAVRVVAQKTGDCRLSATLQKPLVKPLPEPLLFTVAVTEQPAR